MAACGTRRLGGLPRLPDAKLITLAVAWAPPGHQREARWLRIAAGRVARAFPFQHGQREDGPDVGVAPPTVPVGNVAVPGTPLK